MSQPKGNLLAIGGAEDRGNADHRKRSLIDFDQHGILKTLLEKIAEEESPRIEIITTASTVPEELAEE